MQQLHNPIKSLKRPAKPATYPNKPAPAAQPCEWFVGRKLRLSSLPKVFIEQVVISTSMIRARLITRLAQPSIRCSTTMPARKPPPAPLVVILGSTGTGKSEVSELSGDLCSSHCSSRLYDHSMASYS